MPIQTKITTTMPQADLDRLLDEYVTRHKESGEYIDPVTYLDQLEGTERAVLATLLDAYLSRAPRRKFDREAFESSPARPVAEAVELSLTGANGAWPWLLPRLRDQAKLPRDRVAAELAAALELAEQQDRVESYYHQMETGSLPAEGVSAEVLDALGRIVGVSGELLRKAGSAWTGPEVGAAPGTVFARTAVPDATLQEAADATAPPAEAGKSAERDEVDKLFTGG